MAHRWSVDGLFGVKGSDHEAAAGVLQQINCEGLWLDGGSFDGRDLEHHRKQLHAILIHRLSTIEMEGVPSNLKGCVNWDFFGLDIDLGNLEILRRDIEGWWIELSTTNGKSVFVGANEEVDKLVMSVNIVPR